VFSACRSDIACISVVNVVLIHQYVALCITSYISLMNVVSDWCILCVCFSHGRSPSHCVDGCQSTLTDKGNFDLISFYS